MIELIHIEGFGWKLETDIEINCRYCINKNLQTPFFYCKKQDNFICSECNKGFLTCEKIDSQPHTHTKITGLKKR